MRKLLIAGAILCHISTLNAQVRLNEGLLAKYYFQGNTLDESGNEHHGAVSGATLTTDRFGCPNMAFNFNKAGDHIMLPNIMDGLPRSISIWFNAYSIGAAIQHVLCLDYPGLMHGLCYFQVKLINGKKCLQVYISAINDTVEISENSWHHLVVTTLADGTFKYYVDNVLKGTKKFNEIVHSVDGLNAIMIGANRHYNGNYFKGKIDDIRIYKRVLREEEIAALYKENTCPRITIFPVPTFDKLYIDFGANYDTSNRYSFKIINAIGQLVYKTAVTREKMLVDMSSWPGKGVYFVQFIDKRGQVFDVKKIALL